MSAARFALLSLTAGRVVLAALVFAAATASAATAVQPSASAASTGIADHADERARIAAERATAEARFSRRDSECRQRFIVNSCLDDAKAERRRTLDRLRARQLAVDEARRHERTEQRRAELAERSREDAQRERARQGRAPASAAAEASAPIGTPFEKGRAGAASGAASAAHATPGRLRSSAAGVGIKPRPKESKAAREQLEATSRAAFESRQAKAAAHRNEAIGRATERMAKKSPAAQLPTPGAASAAASPARRP